jgi:alanine dehydrogenase
MRILSRRQVLELLSLHECIAAVENAFRLHAEGRTLGPGVLGVPATRGGFHIKAAGLVGPRSYFAAKTNANFPDNPQRFGLPTIRGTVVLADAETGEPLAMMDSESVTALRTGAATAVAAKYLARADSRSATVVGGGTQGEMQLTATASVLPLEQAWVLDTDQTRATEFAARAEADLGIRVSLAPELHAALRESDLCLTCTPSRRPVVFPGRHCPTAPSSLPSGLTVGASKSWSRRSSPPRRSSSTSSTNARRSVSCSTRSRPG